MGEQENWNEMSIRHAKERKVMEERHQFDWFTFHEQAKVKDDPATGAKLAQQINQENKDMIARHYNELKAHPENPDFVEWKKQFEPRSSKSTPEILAQALAEMRSPEEKFRDELREAVAREKSPVQAPQEKIEGRTVAVTAEQQNPKQIDQVSVMKVFAEQQRNKQDITQRIEKLHEGTSIEDKAPKKSLVEEMREKAAKEREGRTGQGISHEK